MRPIALVALSCLLAAALPVAAAEPVEEAVRAAEQGFADAFARRDAAAFAAFIHPEARFMGGTGPLLGRDAVLAAWNDLLSAPEPPFSWRPERVLVSADGTLGMTTGPVLDPTGRHVGAFSSTWQRQPDGTWKVIFDMAPSCPRCPAPAPAPEPEAEAAAAESDTEG